MLDHEVASLETRDPSVGRLFRFSPTFGHEFRLLSGAGGYQRRTCGKPSFFELLEALADFGPHYMEIGQGAAVQFLVFPPQRAVLEELRYA
jgi:hypothetical protein